MNNYLDIELIFKRNFSEEFKEIFLNSVTNLATFVGRVRSRNNLSEYIFLFVHKFDLKITLYEEIAINKNLLQKWKSIKRTAYQDDI